MGLLGCGLVGTPPQRPCDDKGWIDTFLFEAMRYAPDFLNRPTDEMVFFGVGLLA